MEFIWTGTGTPPAFYNKAMLCQRMGWTLTEYDEQPANEIMQLIQILNLVQHGRAAGS